MAGRYGLKAEENRANNTSDDEESKKATTGNRYRDDKGKNASQSQQKSDGSSPARGGFAKLDESDQPSPDRSEEVAPKGDGQGNGFIILGGAVAVLVVLHLAGVTQAIAAYFAPKAPGVLGTMLTKLGQAGSITHWKNKHCNAPKIQNGVYVGHCSCIPLYNYLAFNKILTTRNGEVVRVSDYDAKSVFEITANAERLYLTKFVVENDGTEYFIFKQESNDAVWELKTPTLLEKSLIDKAERAA